MRVRPNSGDWQFADKLFRRYQAKPGSEHIATRTALAYLSACLRLYRPRIVIECGAGIGTMTDALLSHESCVRRLVSFENNKFCLIELTRNIAHHDRSRLTLITRGEGQAGTIITGADMIVADGNDGRAEAYKAARPGSVIFVEGGGGSFERLAEQRSNPTGSPCRLPSTGPRTNLRSDGTSSANT